MERPIKKQKIIHKNTFIVELVSHIYNKSWNFIMVKHNLPNENFECTCDDYCRYGCKHCRTGCYSY